MNIYTFKIHTSALIFSTLCSLSAITHAETDQQLLATGQWRDTQTGLIWMRCSIGQQWNGTTCIGEAKAMEGFEANRFARAIQNGSGFAEHTNWRLPTTAELSTIRSCSSGWHRGVSHQVANIDGTVSNVAGKPEIIGLPPAGDYVTALKCDERSKKPTINTQIFPNTNLQKHRVWWTSEEYRTYNVWVVNFWNGMITDSSGTLWKGHLRLVRN